MNYYLSALGYRVAHINEILQGSMIQIRADRLIDQLLIDSRRLIFPETTLFFALLGPRRDGHDYLQDLYDRGVRSFVLSRPPEAGQLADANLILVPDTLQALQDLATYHRSRFDLPVIGITGSNGKTIVKEWLNQLLEDDYRIVRSPKSYNSQIGVPLSIWQIASEHELAILEAGISLPGEMRKLERIIRPDIGLFTNIGEAHSEGFSDREEKIREKLGLFTHSRAIIFCADHPEVASAVHQLAASRAESEPLTLFPWGKSLAAQVRVLSIRSRGTSSELLLLRDKEELLLSIPFIDPASVENCLQAICVMLFLGRPPASLSARLSRLVPVAMRMELKNGINHCSIINDSYSADLSSLAIALDFLVLQQQHLKRTLILSDILQSGKTDEFLYGEVARMLRQKKVDRLIAVGKRISSKQHLLNQVEGMEARFYPSTDDLVRGFEQLTFRQETVLIKGARVFQFERIDRLLSLQAHETVLEINLDALGHNLREYQHLLRPSTKLMAMVKAFAYGSGTFEIANLLQFHKVDYLAVAYPDEGMALRKAGIRLPIMVMSPEQGSYEAMLQHNLEPVLYSLSLLSEWEFALRKAGISEMPVHIEIETGMNRLGFAPAAIGDLIEALRRSACKVRSVFSHLAASEDPQHDAYTRWQAERFLEAANSLQEALTYPFLKHLANSAAILRHPGLQLDMVRLGIGLYGIDSSHSGLLKLQEISTLRSTIAQIRQLKEGETVGYDRSGQLTRDACIATVRIGYADGYPRVLGNGLGKMRVRGTLAPTIGNICMDLTMLDITEIPGVRENEEVTVFGDAPSVQQVAHWAQTIPYEILTGISQRVKRIYYES